MEGRSRSQPERVERERGGEERSERERERERDKGWIGDGAAACGSRTDHVQI